MFLFSESFFSIIIDENGLKSAFSLLKVIFITDPLSIDLKSLNKYEIFIKSFWFFLRDTYIERKQFLFFYIDFLLSFLYECQQGNFHSNENKRRIFSCDDAITILHEILPIIGSKTNSFQINKNLIISLIDKISGIFGKNSICSIKSKDLIKTIMANPFFLKQITLNEEILGYIFETCLKIENQSFFVEFLNLIYPQLHDITNDSSILRNSFFETLRKTFTSLNSFSNENDDNIKNPDKIENPVDNWKVQILCQIFQNLLISNLGNPNFEYFKLQENYKNEDSAHAFLWDYSRLTKKVFLIKTIIF